MALDCLGLEYDSAPLSFGEGKGTVQDPEFTSQIKSKWPCSRPHRLHQQGLDRIRERRNPTLHRYIATSLRRTIPAASSAALPSRSTLGSTNGSPGRSPA